MDTDDVIKYLKTPKDWRRLSNEQRADTLVLSFIGFVARPRHIPKAVFTKCADAFKANRGKIENETKAVLEVLNELG